MAVSSIALTRSLNRANPRSILDTHSHLIVVVPSGCWIWIGAHTSHHYGCLHIQGKTLQSHRVSYERAIGPISSELQIDHLCRTRLCCNPEHLEAVTCQTNVLRGENNAANNARKTHCIRGHPLSGGNLVVQKNGKRQCAICIKIRYRMFRDRHFPGKGAWCKALSPRE